MLNTRPFSFVVAYVFLVSLIGALCASGAAASHKVLVVNFDQDVESSVGLTGVVINGTPFNTNLALGSRDDDARDMVETLVDADPNFLTTSIGDTTLWVFGVGATVINSASGVGSQGTVVSTLVTDADVLTIDLDPKDTSLDIETSTTNTMGSAALGPLTVTINGTPYAYDPTATDDDLDACAGLWSAGISGLKDATFVGTTTIVIPHCVLDPASSMSADPNLGITLARMDIHIPCEPPSPPMIPATNHIGVVFLIALLLLPALYLIGGSRMRGVGG